MTPTILFGIIETVAFLIPLGALIWNAATLANRVSKNEEDIKNMKTVVEKQNDAILKALEKLNESIQEIRTEVEIIKALRREEVNTTKNNVTTVKQQIQE